MARTVLAAALIAFALGTVAAGAAELIPYKAPAHSGAGNWQGPYAGATFGYQWGDASNTAASPNGVAGGLHAGYNVRHSQFVFGGETDLQWTNADATFAPWKFSNPWFGTLRARAGVTFDNMLFYGTVGLAYGSLRLQNTFTRVSESHTSTGLAAGAGLEIAFVTNWTVRAEYLYVNLNDNSYILDGTQHGIQSSLLRLGISYRF